MSAMTKSSLQAPLYRKWYIFVSYRTVIRGLSLFWMKLWDGLDPTKKKYSIFMLIREGNYFCEAKHWSNSQKNDKVNAWKTIYGVSFKKIFGSMIYILLCQRCASGTDLRLHRLNAPKSLGIRDRQLLSLPSK